ncbi:MAG: efflux RND transporter periplasmic adaptor subunit, partial [Thermoanaerobaculia bacterium]
MRRFLQRRKLWAMAALGLLVAAWAVASARDTPTARVGRRTLRLTVPVNGVLEAVRTLQIGPPQIPRHWEYKIVRLAPEGSRVKAGDPVLAFDTSELERRLIDYRSRAETAAEELEKRRHELTVEFEDLDLAVAEARSELGKSDLKVEVPEGVVADRDLETARLDRRIAEQRLATLEARRSASARATESELAGLARLRGQARERVAELEESIRQMMVLAPRGGTVIYLEQGGPRGGGPGEKPKVGDSVWRGAKVLELPDLGEMRAVGQVDEVELGRLETGQRARLRLDAHAGTEYTGRLERVGHTVARESDAVARKVVQVRVALDRTDAERMRPGMRFQGEIETARLEGVLAVPIEAVTVTPAGPRVRMHRSTGWSEVAVELGERDATYVEVRDGLKEGARIAL